jgi:hypothetical protein
MSPLDRPKFAEECQQELTPREFNQWAEEQYQLIHSTKEGGSAIRMRAGIAKQFMEEVCPLSRWAYRIYGDRTVGFSHFCGPKIP